ncbi:hypothetical protein [Salinigranum marinum]|uniref:hypothetical protein n=1 Tax=Salinigranum marinum TaxID=1515595 RepID=UPI002989BFC0|nr:hypothetical protein [Salinigranum marinum]
MGLFVVSWAFLGYVLAYGGATLVCAVALVRARRIDDAETRRGLVALIAGSGGWAAWELGFLVAPTPRLQYGERVIELFTHYSQFDYYYIRLLAQKYVHSVHGVQNQSESALSFPNNDFSHPFNVVRLGVNERCEDGFDDLGAAGSEIVTLSDQFIHFSHDFPVNSDSELLFCHS